MKDGTDLFFKVPCDMKQLADPAMQSRRSLLTVVATGQVTDVGQDLKNRKRAKQRKCGPERKKTKSATRL